MATEGPGPGVVMVVVVVMVVLLKDPGSFIRTPGVLRFLSLLWT